MKALVTGGAGFIGSHLVDALINEGNEIIVVDNLTSGKQQHLNPKAKFYGLDIRDPNLREIMISEQPRVVFHLAAQTSVSRSVTDPGLDAQINIIGGLNIVTSCIDAQVEKLVYASSSAIYGHPENLPVEENHPIRPLSPYGISKYALEKYLCALSALSGLSYVTLRFANVYGPRQNPLGEGGVMAIFADKMLSGKKPVIFGDGTKTRDYIYVSDVVAAVLAASQFKFNDTFNIGTGVETCDNDVFNLLGKACDYTDNTEYVPDRPGDIRHLYLDCTKAHQLLNWESQVSLHEGIAQTVEYYRSLNRKKD